MTRGLAEITRLGVAMGGDPMTFSGLAGMGDLLATCMSQQSRNRYVGEQLGKGHKIDEIIAEMNQVAEGVKSCRTVLELADEHGVEMPIAASVVGVVHGGDTAFDAYRGLISRKPTHERQPG
jgi:glycerol-3-phosphate dehydrogenase (NAD(P)+)